MLNRIETMNSAAIDRMRESCRLAAECLVMVGERIRAGITTDDINTWVHQYCLDHDALPAPLNYKGFPKSVCTSINDCVCHGIPDGTVIKDGDIINVDVTTIFPTLPGNPRSKTGGYYGDTSVTFYIGEPSEEAKLVTEVARKGLELGIAQVKHGAEIGEIGRAIHEYADQKKCSVVRDYVGHGVGREFHMPPQIPHYRTKDSASRVKMKAGMVFTIEPMINLGTFETELMKDRWTVLTADRKLSAQFEHTVLVTRSGCEVLTARSQVVKHSEDLPWSDLGPLSTPAAFPKN